MALEPSLIARLKRCVGLDWTPVSHGERLISGLGGLCGIAMIWLVSTDVLDLQGATLIVASMGASAVLLFAVPHGPLSQPWNLVVGHAVSALIGVAVAKLIADPLLAGPVAVGLAITAMYYLRAIHPPGGATALTAVAGGASVHELGWLFVLEPVLLNVVVILFVGVLFNAFFPWRRYPLGLFKRLAGPPPEARDDGAGLSAGDLRHAMRSLNVYVDVSEEELCRIFRLASAHQQSARIEHERIRPGRYYSNGEFGDAWAVREVLDAKGAADPAEDLLIFKVSAGRERYSTGMCSRQEFAHWAHYEVERRESQWHRIDMADG